MALQSTTSTRSAAARALPTPAASARVAVGARAEPEPLARWKRLLRLVPLGALLIALAALLIGWFTGPDGMTPAEVARNAHDQVMRDVIQRTGDYSMTIGPLDCVEIAPGRGNCLADAQSITHKADGLMVAVGYVVDPGNGQLELVVKLP